MEKITEYLIQSTVNTSEVKAWEEIVMLPTYGIGKEEKNPIFLEKRVYQGSSGSVYPYPVIEKIEDEKLQCYIFYRWSRSLRKDNRRLFMFYIRYQCSKC